jgi:hypothetical protein
MKRTAKYTLFIGFSFSSLMTYVLMNAGTGFTTLTAVLYLYAATCLIGGVVGYRHAYLKHGQGHEEARIKHILGIHRLKQLFEQDRWLVELDGDNFEASEIRLSEKLVSVRREDEDGSVGVSYPRKAVVSLKSM